MLEGSARSRGAAHGRAAVGVAAPAWLETFVWLHGARGAQAAVLDGEGELLGWTPALADRLALPPWTAGAAGPASLPPGLRRLIWRLIALLGPADRSHGWTILPPPPGVARPAAASFGSVVCYRLGEQVGVDLSDGSADAFLAAARRRFGLGRRAADVLARLACLGERGDPVRLEQVLAELPGAAPELDRLRRCGALALGPAGELRVPWLLEWQEEAAVAEGQALAAGAAQLRRHGLSERERAVAELAAEGLTNRQIATELELSPHTVKEYLSNAYRKLETPGRAGLIALLVRERQG